jgi:Predicted membrane protein
MAIQNSFTIYLLDVFCFLTSCAMLLGYLHFIKWKSRDNPAYTMQGISSVARAAWVKSVMEEKKDILAVQTLRNSTMAATFLASTAILLSVGVLTLTGQNEMLKTTWYIFDFFGEQHENLLPVKLIILLLNLFAAFFFFASSVRLFNYVGYMINTPYTEEQEKVMSPKMVAAQLNRAGDHYSMGMRGCYSMVPLVFWIFGPLFLLFSTMIMIIILFHLDRTPSEVEENFHRKCKEMSCFLNENEKP